LSDYNCGSGNDYCSNNPQHTGVTGAFTALIEMGQMDRYLSKQSKQSHLPARTHIYEPQPQKTNNKKQTIQINEINQITNNTKITK
jgi:hypothetical protein